MRGNPRLLLVSAALLLLAGPAWAQGAKGSASAAGKKTEKKGDKKEAAGEEKTPPPPADPKALALEAYNKGKELYNAGDYQKALESFVAAYNFQSNPFVYISIAQCYEKLGKCQEAKDYYGKYLKEKPDAGNRPDVEEKIKELENMKGKATITSDPEGATVTVDGETLGQKTPVTLEVKGGDHAVALNKDGYVMETQSFTVPICGEAQIAVTLKSVAQIELAATQAEVDEQIEAMGEQEKPAKKAKKARKIKLGAPHYAAFGIAGAAAAAAIITGAIALTKSNEFEDRKKDYAFAPNDENRKKLDDLEAVGKPLAIVCDVSIAVAAVAAVTGIALLFVQPKEGSVKEVSVSPLAAKGGGGAALRLSF